MGFREDKATEAAQVLLKLNGGIMNYMVLIKLLYLADRLSLKEAGKSITGDRHFSMDKGPVLSAVLDNIRNKEGKCGDSLWNRHIGRTGAWMVKVLVDLEPDDLSDADEHRLKQVFDEYAKDAIADEFAFVDRLHRELPEWSDPSGSSLEITTQKLLEGAGLTEEGVKHRLENLREWDRLQRVLGS
jgi:antitoxin SocA-like protein